jgi:hypothetical protein
VGGAVAGNAGCHCITVCPRCEDDAVLGRRPLDVLNSCALHCEQLGIDMDQLAVLSVAYRRPAARYCLLASLGVVAALSVTASSTAQQAHAAGMMGVPAAGLVVLLEVVNVVGSWAVITDTRTHVRVESLIGVTTASTVTGICGVSTYGGLGVVAPSVCCSPSTA